MSGGGSFAHTSLLVGADWSLRCSTYPDTTPILTIDAGESAVSVSIAGHGPMSAGAVRFARELARQAQLFAADCERLHAARQGQASDGQASDDNDGQAPGRAA